MKDFITVVKVGGAVVEDKQQLEALLDSFVNIKGKKLLVHGGGRRATQIAKDLGINTIMLEGRRVTDAAMLEVVTMVYGGLINKNIVAQLQAKGVNAIGLTGADLDVIRADKRPPKGGTDYGFVGDISRVNGKTLSKLLAEGFTPVLAPLSHDGKGCLLNTNADTIANETATALAQEFDVTLVYTFEKKGVLSNPEDEESVIPLINRASFKKLSANGIISGGMLPKLENALAAIESGVSKVLITRSDSINNSQGTIITK